MLMTNEEQNEWLQLVKEGTWWDKYDNTVDVNDVDEDEDEDEDDDYDYDFSDYEGNEAWDLIGELSW